MGTRRARLIWSVVVMALAVQAATASESGDDAWGMRWRVFCDSANGISFRYPYAYFAPDQYKAEVVGRDGGGGGGSTEVVEINGKKVRVLVPGEDQRSGPDVREFSVPATQIPADVAGAGLNAIGDQLCGAKLDWKTFEYYGKSEARPQGNPAWAPKDMQAVIGDSPKRCALLVKHGDRYSGIVLGGALAHGDNQAIVDSFEVMPGGGKGKQPLQTWREAQFKAGKVLDPGGKAIAAAGKGKPVPWKEAWDVETAHYHITSHVSPTRLLQYGIYLEALYKAYTAMYNPDATPPFKLEVHIFNTQADFMAAAAAHGFPVGQSVGGFFVPGTLSIMAYEESSKWGGDSFSVEHVLAHECSHQFLHVTCNGSNNVPTWINEGLAVYFESGVFKNGAFEVLAPHDRISRLRELYDRLGHTLRPLDQYLDHYDHISPDEYGEVYAMTVFWLFGTAKDEASRYIEKANPGLAHFRQYWQALKRREDGTKSFEEIFMKDMIKAKGSREAAVQAWQVAFLDYVKRALR
jgi:hypothetical protein